MCSCRRVGYMIKMLKKRLKRTIVTRGAYKIRPVFSVSSCIIDQCLPSVTQQSVTKTISIINSISILLQMGLCRVWFFSPPPFGDEMKIWSSLAPRSPAICNGTRDFAAPCWACSLCWQSSGKLHIVNNLPNLLIDVDVWYKQFRKAWKHNFGNILDKV